LRAFVKFVDRLSDFCAYFAALALVAATLIVVWMVGYRAMGNSTYWEIEAATYLIVATVLIGSPYCLKTRGHIGVDLVSEWLGPGGRRVLTRVLGVAGLAVCAYLAWQGFELALDAWEKKETSGSSWNPPRWPFFSLMPIGLGLTALQYLADILRDDDREEPDTSAAAPVSGQGA
jgi:TRAP-type C4-dicarboxylate transport system permease small subunit